MPDPADDFSLRADFHGATDESSSLSFGGLENQYQELFAEVLEDGRITTEERGRLERVARSLGLDEERLLRLEEAMTAAYESHHRRYVVDETRVAPSVVAPLEDPSAGPTSIGHVPLLLEENRRLRARIAELEGELERAKTTVSIEVDLGDLRSSASAEPDQLWKLVRSDPTNVAHLEDLRDAFLERGDADGAYLASTALFALGRGGPDDEARHRRSRPTGLIAPSRAFDARVWEELLVHPDEDRGTGTIFALIARAVLVGRVTTLRRDGQLVLGRPDRKQDPATTTVMAARAAGWAAAILGIPLPALYVDPERAEAFTLNPGVPPTTLVGQGALSGRTTQDLAFLAGRHLTAFRAEHFLRHLFHSTLELEDLFLAALLVASPTLPLQGRARARVEPLALAIEPLLEPTEKGQLGDAYRRFVEEGGRTNLQRFVAGVDKTGARAGLALSQDLPGALRLLLAEEGTLGPLGQDLLGFWTSPRHRALRAELGLAARSE